MKRYRLALSAACLPLVFGVAACGGSDSNASSDGATTSAASAAAASPSAQGQDSSSAAPTTTSPSKDKPAQKKQEKQQKKQKEQKKQKKQKGSNPGSVSTAAFLKKLKGAVKNKHSMHLAMTMKAGGKQIKMEGDANIAGKNSAMDLTMKVPTVGKMHMLLVDKTMYISVPGQTQGKFIKIKANDPNNPLGGNFDKMVDSMNPANQFDAFDAGLKKVHYVGTSTVQGEKMKHYKLTLDSKAAMKAQGTSSTAGLPKVITYQLWVDDQNQMRKVTFALPQGNATMFISKWGEKVTVQAPPASKVIKMPR